jgi:hypothetical protein
MLKKIVVLAVLASINPSLVSAQMQGTQQEQAACRPDVMKHCKEVLKTDANDTFKILACLQSYRPRLSKPCQNVLQSHGV